jgi:hypothetical protein
MNVTHFACYFHSYFLPLAHYALCAICFAIMAVSDIDGDLPVEEVCYLYGMQ